MKKNLISSILSLVMTSLLLIGVVTAWYTSNKEVSVSGVVGATNSDKIISSLQKYEDDEWKDDFNFEVKDFSPDDEAYYRIKIITTENNLSLSSGFRDITSSMAKKSNGDTQLSVDNTTNFTVNQNGVAIYKYYKYYISNLLFERKIKTATAKDADLNDIYASVSNGVITIKTSENSDTIATVSNVVLVNNRITSLTGKDGSNNSCTYVLNSDGLSFKLVNSSRSVIANVTCTLTNGTLVTDNSQTLVVKEYNSANNVDPDEIDDESITLGDDTFTLTTVDGKLTNVTCENANLKFKIDSDGLGFRIIDNTLSGVPGLNGNVIYYISGSTLAPGYYILANKLSLYNYSLLLTEDYDPTDLEEGITISNVDYDFGNAKNLNNAMITNANAASKGTFYLYFKISFESALDDNYYQYQTVDINTIFVNTAEEE